jgi:hypothetical protein
MTPAEEFAEQLRSLVAASARSRVKSILDRYEVRTSTWFEWVGGRRVPREPDVILGVVRDLEAHLPKPAGTADPRFRQLGRRGWEDLYFKARGFNNQPRDDLIAQADVVAVSTAVLTDQQRDDLILAFGSVPTPESWASLYEEVVGEALPSATITGTIAQLNTNLSPLPLFRFVEFVAAAVGAGKGDGLHQWVDANLDLVPAEYHAELRRIRVDRAHLQAVYRREVHLLIRLTPTLDDRFGVQAWIMTDGIVHTGNQGPDGELSLTEARLWLEEFLAVHRSGSFARDPVIEFFLPPSQLHLPVHTWASDARDHNEPLGSRFVVLIRPATRTAVGAWEKRWRRLIEQQGCNSADRTQWVRQHPPPAFTNDEWEILAVTCPSTCASSEAMAKLIDLGAPVAFWIPDSTDEQLAGDRLAGILRGWEISRLPERVRGLRRGGADPTGLLFLWDDPTRPAPDPMTWTVPGIKQ